MNKRGSRTLFAVVLLFFFVSGGCGLLYQVVWTRKLVLLFGATAYAVSTVLSIFFLGLGVGSLWGGRLADRKQRPLALYGLFEVLVGLWALLFLVLVSRGETAVVALLKLFDLSPAAGIALRAVMSGILLFVPVALMGATLPLLSKFVTRDHALRGTRIGALYAVNTLGAVAGCFLTGFVFIERFGYTRTTLLGAAANILVGLLALFLERWSREESKEAVTRASSSEGLSRTLDAEVTPHPGPLPAGPSLRAGATAWQAGQGDKTVSSQPIVASEALPRRLAGLVLFAFGLSGFCALALEVVWTRLLAITFLGTTYAYSTMLTTLLCGIALGGFVAALLVERVRQRTLFLGGILLLNAAACLFLLSWMGDLPEKVTTLQRDSGNNWGQVVRGKFVLSFLTLFPPTFLFGMTFPFVVRILSEEYARLGRDLGTLYSANTFGGMLGAIAGGFVLLPLLGTHHSMILLAVALGLGGAAIVMATREAGIAARVGVVLAAAALGAYAWRAAPEDVNRALNVGYIPADHRVLHVKEGVEGTVVVSEPVHETAGSNRVLWINRVQATTSIERGIKMNRLQGVLPLVFDRSPESVLFMCFGSGITAGTLALWDFKHMDAVEISKDVLNAAPYFEVDNLKVIEDEKVNFHVDDGRNFLLSTERHYDVITFEPMPLALAGVSTFYTQEYYRLCLDHLTAGGLVSQWVPLHSLNPEVVRSLVYTFTSVFPEYCTWFVNADLFLIGSTEPLRIDAAVLRTRLENPRLREALAEVGLPDAEEIIAHFFMDKAGTRAFADGGEVLTDDRPWAEFVAPKLVYERKVPEALQTLQPFVAPSLTLLKRDNLGQSTISSLERRHQAHVQDLQGIRDYYGGALGGEAAMRSFIESLTIDPHDHMAQYYLREIAKSRAQLHLQWEEPEKALAVLDEALQYIRADKELKELRGSVEQRK